MKSKLAFFFGLVKSIALIANGGRGCVNLRKGVSVVVGTRLSLFRGAGHGTWIGSQHTC